MGADGLRNRRCPCRSGRKYKRCCQPWHSGTPAPTAEVLMRSRFAAYALGLVDYIQRTTHPDGPHFETDRDTWATGIRLFCQQTRFETLAILAHSEEEDRATVTFRAGLTQSGRDTSFTERSTFLRQEGCWLYLDGEAQT